MNIVNSLCLSPPYHSSEDGEHDKDNEDSHEDNDQKKATRQDYTQLQENPCWYCHFLQDHHVQELWQPKLHIAVIDHVAP